MMASKLGQVIYEAFRAKFSTFGLFEQMKLVNITIGCMHFKAMQDVLLKATLTRM